ncbi:NFX1-type zinc finger-containing protein 1 isoform X2 [Nasonia vitripennis]|uniref:RZ-type domain-containing protein n=1 Tax=Nasonia vitripennis TaxID=7425 RepID=A0A7M7QE53_NASVI|nr:NFX1-type zinc finger-containing protein 1 isoform X2 [Nasonia vitripennis]
MNKPTSSEEPPNNGNNMHSKRKKHKTKNNGSEQSDERPQEAQNSRGNEKYAQQQEQNNTKRHKHSYQTFNNNHQSVKDNPNLKYQRQRDSKNTNINHSFHSNNKMNETQFHFNYLHDLSEKDSNRLMLILASKKDDFEKFLGDVPAQLMAITLRVLNNVCHANFIEILSGSILCHACSEKFLTRLENYLVKLPFESETDKINNHIYYDDINRFWTELTELFKKLMELLPSKACDGLRSILEKIGMIFQTIEVHRKDYKIEESIKNAAINLFEELKAETKRIEAKNEIPRKYNSVDLENEDPPGNFRDLSIIPTMEDINNDKPFIRKCKINQPYNSVDHYLDVQYRLLREDFICPLRNGINEYLDPKSQKNRNSDLRIYKKVKLEAPRIHEDTVGITLCFQNIHNVNWQQSKRLIYGALLLLSNDNFNNILFMTVANRDEKELMNGRILVEPCEGTHVTAQMYNTTFVMLESKIYFEPYWAVLNAIKYMHEDNFPMKNYLINADNSIKLPVYLRNVLTLHYKGFELPVAFDKKWPNANELELDESQLKAFRNALTQEFSLIQGPPGTGKTFIALEIVHTLLANSEDWKKHGPIVVVCLTNHALDQFLEGILEHTNSIVRIGSRSKSEKLNPYTLKEKKKAVRIERGNCSTFLMNETKRRLERILKSITETQLHVQYLKIPKVIVPFKLLIEYCNDMVLQNLDNNRNLIRWLVKVDLKPGSRILQPFSISQRANAIVNDCEQMANIPEFGRYQNSHMDDKLDIDHTFEISDSIRPFFPIEELNHSITEVRQQIFDHKNRRDFVNLMPHEVQRIKFQKNSCYRRLATLNNEKARISQELENHPLLNENRTPSNNLCWENYWGWVRHCYESAIKRLAELEEEYRQVRLQLNEAKQLVDLATLKQHKVVGLTTTGAAKLFSTLRELRAPIVLVEEAAEILESHVVCSLTKNCQQAILIGDHKQLQPKASVYKLGKDYNLNISLFERMVRIRGDCAQLAHQHRMRPQFAKLLTPSIYEQLYNDKTVFNRPNVLGLNKNLFFLNHSNREQSHNNEESWVNKHEVEFLVAFARHLVLQGYKPMDITILCTYTGQLFAFMREKDRYISILRYVRITTVDNFQGEENKIILLSLVRNNGEGNVGFLKQENRVCVALSRAKEGLYIMGNMDDLLVKNDIWPKIKGVLEEEKAIGDVLELRCQIHPDQLILVKDASDFQKSPEGGCSKMCEVDMPCGHRCLSVCHTRDREHKEFECRKKCLKTCPHNHPCTLICYEGCKACEVKVERELKCGHTVQMLCSDDPDKFKCKTLIKVILPACKHETEKPCHVEIEECRCTHPCDVRLGCGHTCTLTCHVDANLDPDHIEYKCTKSCAKNYEGCENNHPCKKRCFEVCGLCPIPVKKIRSCGHYYTQISCGIDIEKNKCSRPCKGKIPSCGHNCKLKCSDPCGNCEVMVEKDSLGCGHKVKVKCSEDATPSKCDGACPKILPCGHQCINKCKDQCTVSCQVMVSLNQTGLCGHLFEVPCFLQKSDPKSANLLQYCNKPCRIQLACDHFCKGNCGDCGQGRIHVFCGEPCGFPLVCGHKCNEPCREECKPCKKKCELRCCHSKCNKKCGEPCNPCVEPCTLGCEHKKCKKRCSELCDIDPCNEPCKKKLKCDHFCVGFCGDPCPPLCRICDEKELMSVFLGREEEPNARFVFLEDCRHCIESNDLSEWLKQDNESIKVKRCPRCTTPINKCARLINQIKTDINNVQLVKKKVFSGKYGDLQAVQKQHHLAIRHLMKNPILAVHPELNEVLKDLHQRTKVVSRYKRYQHLNAQEIDACRVVLDIIRNVFEILSSVQHIDIPKKLNQNDLRIRLKLSSLLTKKNGKIIKSYEFVLPQLQVILYSIPRTFRIPKQRLNDIQQELLRLEYMIKVCNLDAKNCTSNVPSMDQNKFHAVMTKLAAPKRFDATLESEVLESIKKLNDEQLVALERRMIVQAMGFKQGHWYKCPNGHPYAIGDCGGAMQVAKCNECGENIGGTGHRLLSGNQLASEMDGAANPAWS